MIYELRLPVLNGLEDYLFKRDVEIGDWLYLGVGDILEIDNQRHIIEVVGYNHNQRKPFMEFSQSRSEMDELIAKGWK